MAAAPPQSFAFNRVATNQARLTCAPIDRCLASIVAIHTLEVSKIAEGGASCSDADLENMHEAYAQALELSKPEFTSLRCGAMPDAKRLSSA